MIISFFTKVFLISIMIGSIPIFPEASKILQHYCFGQGEKLILNSNYFSKSPVIVSNLEKMRINETRTIKFNQSDDWRLSYAINGFHMTKKKNKVIIKQYIKFDHSGRVFTYLNFGIFELKIYDNIVHVFNCKPFWVYSEFEI